MWIQQLLSTIGKQNQEQRSRLQLALAHLVQVPVRLELTEVSKGCVAFDLIIEDAAGDIVADPEHLSFEDETNAICERVFGPADDDSRERLRQFYPVAYSLMCLNAVEGRLAALPVSIAPVR